MTTIIYHKSDFDGIFCREIAKKHFGNNATYIGWEYGDSEPIVSPEDDLYMLDISIPSLMSHPKLVWIDHHKSAIEKFSRLICGNRIDGVAACRLAWQWFFGAAGAPKYAYIERTVSEPLAVRLAGEYDIWDKRDPDAELFQHGLRSQDLTYLWPIILQDAKKPSVDEIQSMIMVGHPIDLRPDGTMDDTVGTVQTLLNGGRAIKHSNAQENEFIIKSSGFDLQFEGLKFLACNAARYNSFLFVAGTKPEHDALLGFNFDGKKWKVSMYHAPGKEHHDLSLIAVKHLGGGHREACGFACQTLPFNLPN